MLGLLSPTRGANLCRCAAEQAFLVDADRQRHVGYSFLHDAELLSLQRRAQHGDVQLGHPVVGNSSKSGGLRSKDV